MLLIFCILTSAHALTVPTTTTRDCTEWFKANGGTAEAVRAQPTTTGWGLVTTRPVQRGDELTRTPRELCFASNDRSETNVSPAGLVALQILDADPKFEPYLQTLPKEKVPVLWPDETADELLWNSQSLTSRKEILADWRYDFQAVQGTDWQQWRETNAIVMTRSYNVQHLGYAMIPFLDYINHNDEPTAKVADDGESVKLIALTDIPEETQIFASYSAGEPLDGLKMLQAFGWLSDDIKTCNVDFVEALRRDDPLAPAKFELLEAIGGRSIFTAGSTNDVLDALVALRLVAMTDDNAFQALLANVADSPWFNGDDIGNDADAIRIGLGLLDRKLAFLKQGLGRRQKAIAQCSDPDIAALAQATADGEEIALLAFRDALAALR